MEKRADDKGVAIIGIFVEDQSSVERLNVILHDHNEIIAGRMGIPYRARHVCIISVIVDARESEMNELIGKIRALKGVKVQIMHSGIGAATKND